MNMCLFPTKKGFPCGKCAECLSRQRNDWSIRLQFHILSTPKGSANYFATFTYDREHVPWVWCHKAGEQYFYVKSLCKLDVQKFIKLFRIHLVRELELDNVRIKYFCAGEYGPKTHRPHYHILFFNVPCKNKFYIEKLLQKCWPHGEVRRVRELIPAQCHYATKYMITKDIIPNNFSVKPFRMMSNGLGKNLFDNVDSSEFKNRFYSGGDLTEILDHANTVFMYCDTYGFYFSENPYHIVDCNSLFPWSSYDIVVSACRDYIVLNGKKFQIPRYVRNKVYPVEVRFVLNLQKQIKRAKREFDYSIKYGEYDDNQRWNNLPTMKQQINQQKFERMRKIFDKRYKKDINKSKNVL